MSIETKIKLSAARIAHYIYFLLVITVIFVVYILGNFLYKDFYIIITQSEEVVILKKDIATEVVDMSKFKQVINSINKKKQPHEFNTASSPFNN